MKRAPVPLIERLEMAAHACHCAGLLSCEASVREAIVALSATASASPRVKCDFPRCGKVKNRCGVCDYQGGQHGL